MDATNWKNLVRVVLPSGNQAVYTNPGQMNAEQVRQYGLHIATHFKSDGWQVRGYLPKHGRRFRSPTPEEQQLIDTAPLVD